MNATAHWARLKTIGFRDGLLLAEAVLAVTLASIAIAVLPFATLARMLSSGRGPELGQGERQERLLRKGRWAVEAAARRLPWRIVCFQKGLAFHAMMRRRGVATRLHYGVAQSPDEGLRAHVWVTHGGAALVGGEVADQFVCLAIYPPERPRPRAEGRQS
jgi:hypothetical protein